ncbi:hypothetical protein U9294_23425, partial [Escherichia coli]
HQPNRRLRLAAEPQTGRREVSALTDARKTLAYDFFRILRAPLNALLNTAGGATWVSLHHGGGVGMGFSQHAGMVIVCDGTEDADARLARVLWNDPATGVMRHADAGYEQAKACAERHHLNLPMI